MDPTTAPFASDNFPSPATDEEISWVVEHVVKNPGMPSRRSIIKFAQIITRPGQLRNNSLCSLILSGRPLWFVLELWEATKVPF